MADQAWTEFGNTDFVVYPFDVERYCIESLRAVHFNSGDRCRAHGAAPTMCTTDVRPAECEHPHLSPNHPTPHCSECGIDLPVADHA